MHLFCFGLGQVARRLARALLREGWQVSGTTRDAEKAEALRADRIGAHLFAGERCDDAMARDLAAATHLLASIPPIDESDAPDLALNALSALRRPTPPAWVGYLSTTGVYGNADGGWVDEETPPAPVNARSRRRVAAEEAWMRYQQDSGAAVDILRLAGIYGPGRSALDAVRAGRARRIVKPGQVFSRIHVADIVAAIRACMGTPEGLRIYNVCDDEPAPQPDVITYAAALLGVEPPPEENYETAEMSQAMRDFYLGNRRVSNARIKAERGIAWQYPSYKAGLMAIVRAEHERR